jgi:hypothetical protein
MDMEQSRRKDKTFLGGECAVCEEQLEITFRGERIMQLSCGHIAHEACFYEYLREFDGHACPICNVPLSLDSNRGGNGPNMGKDIDSKKDESDIYRYLRYCSTAWRNRDAVSKTRSVCTKCFYCYSLG